MKQAHELMTIAEQVAFAWKHRDHFEQARIHNLQENSRRYRGEMSGSFRNAWAELANDPEAKPVGG